MSSRRRRSGGHTRRRLSPLTVAGLVLVLAGLAALGWAGYQYVGTNLVAERAFTTQNNDLRAQWERDPSSTPTRKATPRPTASSVPPPSDPSPLVTSALAPGDPIGLLRVPKFGSSFEVPILSGTDLDTLSRGVGHYRSTSLPGQVGNFAVAGHRVTHGQPFERLLDLDQGDEVVVETGAAVYTYVVDQPPRALTVTADDSWVLDPVPGQPGEQPTQALMTLTTCQDLFHSPDRSVGFAHLASTKTKG